MGKMTRESEMRRTAESMRHLLLAFKARVDDRLRERKVTTAQLRLLHELRQNPGLSGAQLARQCYVTPQTAQAMLVRSVKAGLVARGVNRENNRLVTARLTPAGEKLLAYAEEIRLELERELWAGITMQEMQAVSTVAERALQNFARE